MGKSLYIAEKPSVAQEFAKALHINTQRKDGYLESAEAIVTWCVGHLVTMSYPEEYDPALKRWSLETLPFIPQEFKYEVIPAVSKQFRIVSGLLNRTDVDTIYVCTGEEVTISLGTITDKAAIDAVVDAFTNGAESEWPLVNAAITYDLKFLGDAYPFLYFNLVYGEFPEGVFLYDRNTKRCVEIGDMLTEWIALTAEAEAETSAE